MFSFHKGQGFIKDNKKSKEEEEMRRDEVKGTRPRLTWKIRGHSLSEGERKERIKRTVTLKVVKRE